MPELSVCIVRIYVILQIGPIHFPLHKCWLSLARTIALTKERIQPKHTLFVFCVILTLSGPAINLGELVSVHLCGPWDKLMFLKQVGRGLGWSEEKGVRGNKEEKKKAVPKRRRNQYGRGD